MTFEHIVELAKRMAALRATMNDAELDKRIAERGGDPAKIDAAAETYSSALSAWHKVYMEGGDALEALCKEHGIAKSDLRGFL